MRTALLYGADAVYLGGYTYNLRAAAEGFDELGLTQGVREAEAEGARVYYTLNSLPKQEDMAALPAQIEQAAAAGVHAFIIADPGVLRLARKHAPKTPVHLSTQSNTTNAEAVAFWLDQGVERVNLARELNREEIAAIRNSLPQAELEVFVQGAMCLAVSGQCLLSSWLNRRPANMGRCTQPCRFDYKATHTLNFEKAELRVGEALRAGEDLWRVRQNEKYSSFWAPDDLCLLPFLPWFIKNEITAIKVEGRTKTAAYVAHMADIYKSALRAAASGQPFDDAAFMRELLNISSRSLCSGFFLPGERTVWPREETVPSHQVIARILAKSGSGEWVMEIRANWPENAQVELMLPGLKRPRLERYELINHRGERAGSLPNGIKATLICDQPGIKEGIFLRLA